MILISKVFVHWSHREEGGRLRELTTPRAQPSVEGDPLPPSHLAQSLDGVFSPQRGTAVHERHPFRDQQHEQGWLSEGRRAETPRKGDREGVGRGFKLTVPTLSPAFPLPALPISARSLLICLH